MFKMNELVQDLTSALEESELKIEVDEISSTLTLPRRKNRRHKPSPVLKEKKVASHAYKLPHCHASLCCNRDMFCKHTVSASDTDGEFVLPAIRKHRRKKTKQMETESFGILYSRVNYKNKDLQNKHMDMEIKPVMDNIKLQRSKPEDESGLSASEESNEDTNANDGDDEMTDYYNDGTDGPVCGVPCAQCWWEDEPISLPRHRRFNNREVLFKADSFQRGFHARMNRLPGIAARSVQRGRRKFKYKMLQRYSNT